MESLTDIHAASTAELKHVLALDMAKKKKAAESYYGFIAQHGKCIPFLTPKQLAKALAVSLKTLERQRRAKTGPPFIKMEKHVRYPIVELDRWVRENLITADSPKSSTTN